MSADTEQERVADILFDHEVGLGLEIVRYNIGASGTDPAAVNSLRPGGAVPSLLLPNGTYDFSLARHRQLTAPCTPHAPLHMTADSLNLIG